MSTYSICLNANVQNANAFNGYVNGFSTPLTVIGFCEYLKLELLKILKLNESIYEELEDYNPDYPADSFSYAKVSKVFYGFCGNTFTLHKGHERFIPYMKSHDLFQRGSKTQAANAPVTDTKRFSSDFFVCFELKFDLDTEPTMSQLQDSLYNILQSSNFSGGKIFNVYKHRILINESSISYNAEPILKFLIRSHNDWFTIIPANEINLRNEHAEPFENLIQNIKRPKRKKDNTNIYKPYYMPTIVGYRYLTELREPSGQYNYKNVLAEPMLSVVRCSSLKRIKDSAISECLWSLSQNQNYIQAINNQ